MMKRLVSLVLLAVLAVSLLPVTSMAEDVLIMYVYTENGKRLNVRSAPSTNSQVLDKIDYGEAVHVLMTSASGWATIEWINGEGGVAYVQSRFLVTTKPAAKTSGNSNGTKNSTASNTGTTVDAAKVLANMNKEFAAGKLVEEPFTVIARPSRASGWVNLRWAPSTEAARIATCPQGKELTVIAELKTWYQVQDPETGMIGFISMKYVTIK